MRRLAIVGALAAVLAAAPGHAAAAGPMRITTSVTPRWLYFAGAVVARVDLRFDPRRVDPGSITVNTSFAPWEEIAPARVSTTTGREVGHRTWWFTVACLSIDCLPRGTAPQRFQLAKATVTARARDGAELTIRRAWLPLKVAGRFAPAHTVGLRPVFQLDRTLPTATYRVDPGSLATALDVLGGLMLALGLGLGALGLSAWSAARRGAVDTTPPLVRALALLRQAQERDGDDRRRAANLLARVLSRQGSGLRSRAAEVAWSPAEPTPVRLEELARAVEERDGDPT